MPSKSRILPLIAVLTGTFLPGCSTSHYRKAADKDAYSILQQKQQAALGHTNAFSIDTPYSSRNPEEIKKEELIESRKVRDRRKLSLQEALQVALENSRNYQLRKEDLYLSSLTLTGARHRFEPLFFAGTTYNSSRYLGEYEGKTSSQIGVKKAFKNGATLSLSIANDLLSFYTGRGPGALSRTPTLASLNIQMPLLRGAGAAVVTENLTQAERNVVYEVRDFSHFQNSFALDIITTYFRLLQQGDSLRNEYNNYQTLIMARERAVALSKDRLPAFQADQARQDELSARSRYISAVARFNNSLDQFKQTLGLPLGVEISLDDSALQSLQTAGLIPLNLDQEVGFAMAVEHRLDLLNDIDRFEDSKRKIKVAANQLKADVSLFADASLFSGSPNYAKFDFKDYKAGGGVAIDLPIDRLDARNQYRRSIIEFEREIRSLTLSLDQVKSRVRDGLVNLSQARQNYEIQLKAVALADQRVESANLLLQAGRAQIRDQLDAQNSQLQARNALTQALVDYHVNRLNLLLNLGLLDTTQEQFWLSPGPLASNNPAGPGTTPATTLENSEVVPPDQLFPK